MMARKKAEVVEEIDEVTDVTEVEEDEAEAAEASGGEMLTAKAAASLLKTDGRTLRKFLRKEFGTVGQGQRWEIDPADMPELKTKFEAWGKGSSTKESKETKAKTKSEAKRPEPVADLDADELEEISDIDEIEDLDFGDD